MKLGPTSCPQATFPIADKQGVLTQPWLQFLIALWNRTGGSIPDTPEDDAIVSLLMGVQSDETSVSKTDDRSIAALIQGNSVPQARNGMPAAAFESPSSPVKEKVSAVPVESQTAQDGRRYMQPFLPQDTQPRNQNALAGTVPAIEDRNAARNAFVMVAMSPTPEGTSSRSWSVKTVTVGSSPYSYPAPSNGFVAIDGGAVSLIEFSRDGTTFISVGTGAGAFPVRKGDLIRTTYTSLPTISFVPM